MGLRVNPSQRQRRLGQELRRLREKAGLSAAEAGERVGIRRNHMSDVEAGRTHIPEEKVRTLLAFYGCAGSQLADALAVMTRSTGKGWWSEYRRHTGDRLRDLAELESTATSHADFQWMYVPGLLQTADYMRALFANSEPPLPAEDLERFVEFRLRRQAVLTEEPLPRYQAVIHEAAFHMRFVDRRIMREQLDYLVEVCQFPNVTVQLLPFRAEVAAGPGAPFTVFGAAATELRTVHLEHPAASTFLGDQESVARFTAAFQRLGTVAHDPLDPAELHDDSTYRLVQHLLYIL